jgi:hypothetical protein
MTKHEMLLSGPGLDGYAYRAALYCIACGQRMIWGGPDTCADASNSEATPQPVFFGESDSAEHCDCCGKYLYGPNI